MRRARVDRNELEIVKALRQMGCTVERIRSLRPGCPDLLIGRFGVCYLAEIKVPKTGRLSEGQVKWHAEWQGGKPVILRSVDDAIAFVNKGRTK